MEGDTAGLGCSSFGRPYFACCLGFLGNTKMRPVQAQFYRILKKLSYNFYNVAANPGVCFFSRAVDWTNLAPVRDPETPEIGRI